MNIGMLWFDNDPKRELTAKVSEAADYYRKKYGRKPSLCYVHPLMLPKEELTAGEVQVQANEAILPNHLWIGVGEQPQKGN